MPTSNLEEITMAEVTRTETVVRTTEPRYTLVLDRAEYEYLNRLMGNQEPDDGEGASQRIWDALKAPKDGGTEPETFRVGDSVKVLAGAKSAVGGPIGWDGPAVVEAALDSDGDYFIHSEDGDNGGYVHPRYLTRR